MPIIKKHSNKNEYVLSECGLWVRNYTNTSSSPEDINRITRQEEFQLLLDNEFANQKRRFAEMETKPHPNVVIVSSGYKFSEKQNLLLDLPKNVTVLGTNKSLAEWKVQRIMDYYVVNNPYDECARFLPKHKYHPACISSIRTSPKFLNAYRGNVHLYSPASEPHFSNVNFGHERRIDDYRNPICAAIGVAALFGVEKLLLLCCDDSFEQERPGSEKLENGLWSYPPQQQSRQLIDTYLYWLKAKGIQIADHSSGLTLSNAAYISEEGIKEFFKE